MSNFDESYVDQLIASSIAELTLERLAAEGIWQTKDGNRVKIENMSDSHLRNTINMLKRSESDWGDGARTSYIRQMEEEVNLRQKTGKTILESIYIKDYDEIPDYVPSDGFGDFEVSQS